MSVDHHPMAVKADQAPGVSASVDRHPTVIASPTPNPLADTPGGKSAKRQPCTCAAYRWPHRPRGGLCRWPDPPLAEHPTPTGTNRPNVVRRRGLRKWIMREYGLHPIQDRVAIERMLPRLYALVQAGEWPPTTHTRQVP